MKDMHTGLRSSLKENTTCSPQPFLHDEMRVVHQMWEVRGEQHVLRELLNKFKGCPLDIQRWVKARIAACEEHDDILRQRLEALEARKNR